LSFWNLEYLWWMILTNLGDLKSVNRSWSNAIKLWLLPCLIQLSKKRWWTNGRIKFLPRIWFSLIDRTAGIWNSILGLFSNQHKSRKTRNKMTLTGICETSDLISNANLTPRWPLWEKVRPWEGFRCAKWIFRAELEMWLNFVQC